MRGNFGLKLQNSPKLPHMHARLHCNANEKKLSVKRATVARACTFSRALRRLRVITLSFDWFTGLPPSFLIGQSNYFGFGFTTLK